MKIVVIGATGMVGSRVVAEAVRRGHEVTAATRNGTDVPGAHSVAADLTATDAVRALAADADAVVIAVPTDRKGGSAEPVIDAHRELIETPLAARLVVVGGAGSLQVGDHLLKDEPDFPAAYEREATAFTTVLDDYRNSTGVDWTLISPAPVIAPGEPTGYVTALDEPAGERVSAEDFADAIVDELEHPQHRGRRFTAASL